MNNLFQSARIKLTIWYLCILMTISILFSLAIYTGVNREFVRFERFQHRVQDDRDKIFLRLPNTPRPPSIDTNMISESRMRVISSLFFINITILMLAGLAGYFLAGKTLEPIQKTLEEQKRFITDASHELRTPLTSLRTEIEVGLLDKDLSLKGAKGLIKSNLEEVIKLQSLSDKLLTFANFEKMESATRFSSIPLSSVVGRAIKNTQTLARTKKILIRNKVGTAVIHGNEELLVELFIILLDNSIKYGVLNGKTIITSVEDRERVDVFVSDNGIGISNKDLPHIFERFYRGEDSRSKNISGYGLGLSIAKKIIDLHQGAVFVDQESKKGTTFIVSIPRQTIS